MVKLSIMILDGPYAHEKPFTALRFALTSKLEGHEAVIILIQDGIYNAKKEQNPNDYPNHLEYLQNCISEGVKVIVCGVCCKSRGLNQEDLLNGAELVGMHEIVQAVASSDKHISF